MAGDDDDVRAVDVEARECGSRNVRERRRRIFELERQRHPCLQAVHAHSRGAILWCAALRMHDAAARRHPVDIAWRDALHAAEAVAMQDCAVEQVCHRGEADMRMRAYVEALSRREVDRSEVIEEDERTHRLPRKGRQDAADDESAEIAGVGPQDGECHGGCDARVVRS